MNTDQRIDKLEAKIDTLYAEVVQCRVDIAGLKVKSGVWGLIAGAVPVAIALVFKVFE